jgi:superfamily II DNA or RNA helicase
MEPVACYEFEKDPDGILPSQLVILEGYLDIVVRELRDAGYRAMVVNYPSHGRKSRLRPCWSQLEGESWKYKQKEILRHMLAEPIGRFSCPPGYGKSWLIGQFCKLVPKAQIDITTASADVIRQLYEYLLDIGLPSVGLVGAGKKIYDKRITCYCAGSLHHSRKKADILLADEVHELGTDRILAELAEYTCARRFAFSASHDLRPDGADFELLGVFGPILLEISYPDGVKHGCVVPIEVNWNPVLIARREYYDNIMDRERFGLWRNSVRNTAVAQRARFYEKAGDQVLVVVSKIEHAMYLKRHLPDFSLCYGELSPKDRKKYVAEGFIPASQPQMTLERRLMLTRAFRAGKLKKVIATGVWNRGVDFRGLGVLVRADGQASPIADIQVPGRLSRIMKEAGKRCGIVEDFMDQHDSALAERGRRRRSSYRRFGWRQRIPSRRKMSPSAQATLF